MLHPNRPSLSRHSNSCSSPKLPQCQLNELPTADSVDQWLLREVRGRSAQTGGTAMAGAMQVSVFLFVHRAEGLEEGPFVDPDIFTLYATARVSRSFTLTEDELCYSPRAILDRFEGTPCNLDAPGWIRGLLPGHVREIRLPLEDAAHLFFDAALRKACLEEPGLSIKLVDWVCSVSVHTNERDNIRGRAIHHGFIRQPFPVVRPPASVLSRARKRLHTDDPHSKWQLF